MAAIFVAAVGDARFALDVPSHRQHSSDGFSSDWRIRVVSGPAPAGAWHAAPAFGATRTRRRTVACRQLADTVANRHPAVYVFRRHEVLLHEGLLDKDGRVGSSPPLYICRPPQSGHGRPDAHESPPEQTRRRRFARALGHRGGCGTMDRTTVKDRCRSYIRPRSSRPTIMNDLRDNTLVLQRLYFCV